MFPLILTFIGIAISQHSRIVGGVVVLMGSAWLIYDLCKKK
jgi:hypothetical protein